MPAGNLKHEEAIAMARMLKNLFGASSTIPDSNDFFRSIRYNDLYDVYNEEAEEEEEDPEERNPTSAHCSSDHKFQV